MNFSLDQLLVLEAIDRSGSFSAAAQALHRSTPAVSYAVRALEEALEVPIFDRSGHRAVLTPAGQQVLREARQVLDRARGLVSVARQLRQDWEPRLLVAIDGVLPMGPVLRALRRLVELGAPTHVQVRVEYLSGVQRCFFEEGADLALALDMREDPALQLLALPPVELWLLAHKDHPLHQLGRPVDRGDLAQHVELVVSDSGEGVGATQLRLHQGSPHVFQVGDFHSKLEAIREKVGFGWIPIHLCEALVTRGELLPLPLAEGSQHVFVPRLVERAGRRRGRAAEALVAALLEELQRAQAGT